MQPTIVVLDEKKVIGLGTRFISILSPDRDNHLRIPELWGRFMHIRSEIPNPLGARNLGVCERLADPAEKAHPDEFFYLACTEVARIDRIPAGMTARVIPAGTYAAFTHRGPVDKLADTMRYIYDSWLPASGRSRRDAPELELYDERFDAASDTSEFDVLVPVQ